MAGGNMERMLLGEDSSSGDSDNEQSNVDPTPMSTSTSTTIRPPIVANATAAPAISAGAMSQSEMAQRLKSMYSPASKAVSGVTQSPPIGAVPAALKPIPQHQPQHAQQQLPNSKPSYRPSSNSTVAAPSVPQQPQRGVVHQQHTLRPNNVPHGQQLQQRQNEGIAPQHAPTNSITNSYPSEQQRPMLGQHRPSARLPHQQQNARPQPQPQGQTQAPSNRTIVPSGTGQTTQQMGTPRSSYNVTNTLQMSQQQIQDRAVMEKKQKEKFLIFTRVLMKYLEQKDPPLHLKVKAIIKDCAERNKKKEPGYESVTASMKIQLRKVVNDTYWKKAEAYLDHFLKEKSNIPAGGLYNNGSTANSSNNSSHDTTKRNPSDMQMLQQRPHDAQRNTFQEPTKPNLPLNRDEQAKKRQVPTFSSSNKSATQTKAATNFPAMKEKPKSRAKGATTPTGQQQRKPSLPPTANTEVAVPAPVVPMQVNPPPIPEPREYNELMEHVDHAFSFDWTVAGSLLGDFTYATLIEEQQKLIADPKPNLSSQEKQVEAVSFPLAGWSQQNVISARVAWSRLRLGRKQMITTNTPSNPMIANGLLGIPLVQGKKPMTIDSLDRTDSSDIDMTWYNEEKAEEDMALAVLSMGAEFYIKSVLEKALHCARQRQNLDGIRLWHQQFARGEGKPALSLRMGCDVERQVSQSIGNAAMTYKRMEEALQRQSNIPLRDRDMNDETFRNATSMSDLSMRPQLGRAAECAESEAKRNFEIYGGKNSHEPPLGRVAKVPKLEVVDFQTGMTFTRRKRRHQASTTSLSLFF